VKIYTITLDESGPSIKARGADYGTGRKGIRQYELTGHLGNVRAVIGDRLKTETAGTETAYKPELLSATDYFPFGMQMPGRVVVNGEGYRYGFQGQESENEMYGDGNASFYKYRISNNWNGRFFAVDPLAASFHWNSQYAFSENSVIAYIELEGLEKVYFGYRDKTGTNITGVTRSQAQNEFESRGFRWSDSWHDTDAANEVWTVGKGSDYWGNSTGTYIDKYASDNSYNSGNGKPYHSGASRNFIQWLAAKDESLEGKQGFGEGLKLMGATAGVLLSGGGLALGGVSALGITFFATSAAVTLDQVSAIGDEDTFLEAVTRNFGGDNAVKALQVSIITFGAISSTKGTIDIAMHLKDGNKVAATFDFINKVWTQISTVTAATQMGDGEK
jgi:hypothetical protein